MSLELFWTSYVGANTCSFINNSIKLNLNQISKVTFNILNTLISLNNMISRNRLNKAQNSYQVQTSPLLAKSLKLFNLLYAQYFTEAASWVTK